MKIASFSSLTGGKLSAFHKTWFNYTLRIENGKSRIAAGQQHRENAPKALMRGRNANRRDVHIFRFRPKKRAIRVYPPAWPRGLGHSGKWRSIERVSAKSPDGLRLVYILKLMWRVRI